MLGLPRKTREVINMAIAIARKEEGPKNFQNGYGETEWLPEVYPLIRTYKCVLKAGNSICPELFSDKTQRFCFTDGTGYITSPKKAYNIEEISFFIPDFSAEEFQIHAVTDLEYMKLVVDMLDSDKAAYEDTHMVLPSFKKFSELEEYDQSCKGPHTRSWSVVHSGNLGRVLMGIVRAEGEGTDEKGHPSVAQWNYCLKGSDFKLTVDGETIDTKEGDWSYVPAGLDHSLLAEPGKKVFYIWFEHKVEEVKLD